MAWLRRTATSKDALSEVAVWQDATHRTACTVQKPDAGNRHAGVATMECSSLRGMVWI